MNRKPEHGFQIPWTTSLAHLQPRIEKVRFLLTSDPASRPKLFSPDQCNHVPYGLERSTALNAVLNELSVAKSAFDVESDLGHAIVFHPTVDSNKLAFLTDDLMDQAIGRQSFTEEIEEAICIRGHRILLPTKVGIRSAGHRDRSPFPLGP